MPTVHFPRGLIQHTGGVEALAVEAVIAPRVHELILVLTERFPGLAGSIEDMAIAIDGEIHQDAGYQPLAPDSEVHLIPRIAGGQPDISAGDSWPTGPSSNGASPRRRPRRSPTST